MKEKLRIAIFEPSRKAVGGGQKVMAKIAHHLSKKNYVEVFTQYSPNKNLDFGKSKITILKPKYRFIAPIVFMFKKVKNFDLIILGGFPANLGSLRNKNCITICYSPTRVFYDLKDYLMKNSNFLGKLKITLKNIFLKKIDFISYQKTSKILAISGEVKERVRKYYKRDCDVLYPGVEFKKYKAGNFQNYFLSVSRLVSAKRIDIIVKAMKQIENKGIHLLLIGEGPEKEKLKKLAEKDKRIKFVGCITDNKLYELYSKCLSLIYIPINEDFGLVPVEAGASKKPTIGVKEGGLKETILDEKTGFLIENPDPEKLAEKMELLMADKKLAEKMGNQAYKYCKKFDWENILKELDQHIYEMIKKGQ